MTGVPKSQCRDCAAYNQSVRVNGDTPYIASNYSSASRNSCPGMPWSRGPGECGRPTLAPGPCVGF